MDRRVPVHAVSGGVAAYRSCFSSSVGAHAPWVVLCLHILVADSDDEASWWFRCVQRRYLDLLRCGGTPMQPPEAIEFGLVGK